VASTVPVYYDCEASGLDGVPIEIGWAFADTQTGAITSEGHLVRPPPDWPVEESWDSAAEALHGITLDQLRGLGCSVWEIAQRMNRVLAGRELFSDGPLDEVWLTRILDEARLDPAFTIRRMDAEVLISKVATDRGLDAGGYAQAKTAAARLAPRGHRAGSGIYSLRGPFDAVMAAGKGSADRSERYFDTPLNRRTAERL
jgi:hypothetical protein